MRKLVPFSFPANEFEGRSVETQTAELSKKLNSQLSKLHTE